MLYLSRCIVYTKCGGYVVGGGVRVVTALRVLIFSLAPPCRLLLRTGLPALSLQSRADLSGAAAPQLGCAMNTVCTDKQCLV